MKLPCPSVCAPHAWEEIGPARSGRNQINIFPQGVGPPLGMGAREVAVPQGVRAPRLGGHWPHRLVRGLIYSCVWGLGEPPLLTK